MIFYHWKALAAFDLDDAKPTPQEHQHRITPRYRHPEPWPEKEVGTLTWK